MPPLSDCSMPFLKDVMAGRKRLLSLSDVRTVAVPRFKEFSARNLLGPALQDPELKPFLPDLNAHDPINKTWFFNVIETVKPGWWKGQIDAAMQRRLESASQSKQPQAIEMLPAFQQLIQNSRHVPHSSRGKVLSHLVVGRGPQGP